MSIFFQNKRLKIFYPLFLVSITPLVSYLEKPIPVIPHRTQFNSEGFAVFTEKGLPGKICAEGMERGSFIRKTVAESLCKALGYE